MSAPLPPRDDDLLDELRVMWEENDPVPPHLAERVIFAVELESLDAELAVLAEELLEPVGARGSEPARTLTFTSEHASVMVTLTPLAGGRFRLDGWVAPAGPGAVELRRTGVGADPGTAALSSPDRTRVDAEGRFVLDAVAPGLVQLVYRPDAGGALTRPISAPAVRL